MSASNLQIDPNTMAPEMPEEVYKDAVRVFKVPSTMYNEKSMTLYIWSKLLDLDLEPTVDDYGNILVTKGKGPLYPCFLSHLDTVHIYKNGFNLMYQKKNKRTYLYAADNDQKSVGIGGDDKCGIIVCLYLLQQLENVKIVFCSQEESGGTGSSNVDLKFFSDCKFLCSVDRWNGHDFVNQYSGQRTISKAMTKLVTPILKMYDYDYASGLFTDCFNIIDRGVGISCFNISCGYYSHHSDNEYVDTNELWNACLLSMELAALPDQYKLQYQKKKYGFSNSWSSDKYSSWYNSNWKDNWKDKDDKNAKIEADLSTKALAEYIDQEDEEDYEIPVCLCCQIELMPYEIRLYGHYCSTCADFMIEKDKPPRTY